MDHWLSLSIRYGLESKNFEPERSNTPQEKKMPRVVSKLKNKQKRLQLLAGLFGAKRIWTKNQKLLLGQIALAFGRRIAKGLVCFLIFCLLISRIFP